MLIPELGHFFPVGNVVPLNQGATMKQFHEMSNIELLTLLIGEQSACNLGVRSLSELFGFSAARNGLATGETLASYYSHHQNLLAAKELIARCFQERMISGEDLTSPSIVKQFLCSKIGSLEHEVFWCLWLDNSHRLIAAEELFRGTLSQASVYPREIVKRALAVNAAAIILAHNHPSGETEPSTADIQLTQAIKSAVALVDVRVLDHFVVGGTDAISFAEKGLL
jgi:DNA repair protein RadC